jgi:hypothetical protein
MLLMSGRCSHTHSHCEQVIPPGFNALYTIL